MIVKKNLKISKTLRRIGDKLLFATVIAVIVYALYERFGMAYISLPFEPLAVLGTAWPFCWVLETTTPTGRWWEARTLWGNVLNGCHAVARTLLSATHHTLTDAADKAQIIAYRREMIYRQIAFAHALRYHLREQEDQWHTLQPLLPAAEYEKLLTIENKPNWLLHQQDIRFKVGVETKWIAEVNLISFDMKLTSLQEQQGHCERIKRTPMLRQYTYFTHLFLWVFLLITPFSLLSLVSDKAFQWMVIPLSFIVAFMFSVLNRTGEISEDPFENKEQDVPMTAICNNIERDLRQLLGETELPPKVEPKDGYLF